MVKRHVRWFLINGGAGSRCGGGYKNINLIIDYFVSVDRKGGSRV